MQEPLADGVADDGDVGGEAGHQVAGAFAPVKILIKPGQVGKELVAEGIFDLV